MDSEIFFYGVGGALCVVALLISFVGIRNEDFPPSRRTVLGGLTAVFVVVAAACAGAVVLAREEQDHRRAELAHLAEEGSGDEAGEEAPTEPSAEEEPAPPAAEEPTEAPADEEAPAPETADADGGALFVSNGCGSCHTLAVAGSDSSVGPNFDEVLLDQDAAQVRESIVEPSAELSEGFSDGIMPTDYGTSMTDVEIDALVEYLLESAG